MPMNFPDMKSLKYAAEVHKFRQPQKDEDEKIYRCALANYVAPRDKIESDEIRFGIGWDQWSNEQKKKSLFGSYS